MKRENASLFEVWSKYQDVAMHFNDLILQLRTLSLGGVAALAALGSALAHGPANEQVRLSVLAAILSALAVLWLAIWILDFQYYNRLLLGAVDALKQLETASKASDVPELQLSTIIEEAVAARAHTVVAPKAVGGSTHW